MSPALAPAPPDYVTADDPRKVLERMLRHVRSGRKIVIATSKVLYLNVPMAKLCGFYLVPIARVARGQFLAHAASPSTADKVFASYYWEIELTQP